MFADRCRMHRNFTTFLGFPIPECAGCTRVARFVTHDARTNVSANMSASMTPDSMTVAVSPHRAELPTIPMRKQANGDPMLSQQERHQGLT